MCVWVNGQTWGRVEEHDLLLPSQTDTFPLLNHGAEWHRDPPGSNTSSYLFSSQTVTIVFIPAHLLNLKYWTDCPTETMDSSVLENREVWGGVKWERVYISVKRRGAFLSGPDMVQTKSTVFIPPPTSICITARQWTWHQPHSCVWNRVRQTKAEPQCDSGSSCSQMTQTHMESWAAQKVPSPAKTKPWAYSE